MWRQGLSALALVACVPWVAAQPQVAQGGQRTSGANSPIINGNTAPVTVNMGSPNTDAAISALRRVVQKDLAGRPDAASVKLRSAIARGDYDGARKLVAQGLETFRAQVELVALLKYVDGMLSLLDRRPVDAELAFRAATSLQPGNCAYLGIEGTVLVGLDRLAEAAVLAMDSRPEVVRCKTSAPPVERALVLYLAVNIAAERRDKALAVRELASLAIALDQLALDEGSDQIELKVSLACQFPAFARYIRDEKDGRSDMARDMDRCSRINARLAKGGDGYIAFWSEENFVGNQDDPASAKDKQRVLSAAIVAIDSVPMRPNMGWNPLWMKLKRAELFSNRGFHELWQLRDPKSTRRDYAQAYATLAPLLPTQRPEVWNAYRFLAGRLLHFNELFPAQQLTQVSPQIVRHDLAILGAGESIPDSMDFCEILYGLRELAKRVSVVGATTLVQSVERRRATCLASMADKTTSKFHAQEFQTFEMEADGFAAAGDLVQADAALSQGLAVAQGLFGYPHYMEAQYDYWQRVVQRGAIREASGRHADAEQDYRGGVDLARASGNDYLLSTGLVYLATHLTHQDPPSLQEAEDLAVEAAQLRRKGLTAPGQPSCASTMLYGDAQRLATQIAILQDDYATTLSQLDRFAESRQFALQCEDVRAAFSDESTGGRLSAMSMVMDAIVAGSALPREGFTSVREAATANRQALENIVAKLDKVGFRRAQLPIIDLLLNIAGAPSPTPAN